MQTCNSCEREEDVTHSQNCGGVLAEKKEIARENRGRNPRNLPVEQAVINAGAFFGYYRVTGADYWSLLFTPASLSKHDRSAESE